MWGWSSHLGNGSILVGVLKKTENITSYLKEWKPFKINTDSVDKERHRNQVGYR